VSCGTDTGLFGRTGNTPRKDVSYATSPWQEWAGCLNHLCTNLLTDSTHWKAAEIELDSSQEGTASNNRRSGTQPLSTARTRFQLSESTCITSAACWA
jgi:hypothetical protein